MRPIHATARSAQPFAITPAEQARIDKLNGRDRKLAITQLMTEVHREASPARATRIERTSSNPSFLVPIGFSRQSQVNSGGKVIGALARFGQDDRYVDYIDRNRFFKSHEKILADWWLTGMMNQKRVKEHGQDHPFVAMKKLPICEYTGIYCHAVTLQPPSLTAKAVGLLYTGSAQAGVMDGSKSTIGFDGRLNGYRLTEEKYIKYVQGSLRPGMSDFRIMMDKRLEMSDHGLFSYPIRMADLVEYEGLLPGAVDGQGKKIRGDFNMSREKWSGWTLVSAAWWIAIGDTRLDHFRGVCGDDQTAAELLMPIVLADTGAFGKTPDSMSTGLTHLNESYVMFDCGIAPDFIGSGGSRSMVDALVSRRKNDPHEIWVHPPENVDWHTANQRITAFEDRGAAPNNNRIRYLQQLTSVSSACDVPYSSAAITSWVAKRQNKWTAMPLHSNAYPEMSLPDMSKQMAEAEIERSKSILHACALDADGQSVKIKLEKATALYHGHQRQIFPHSSSKWWRQASLDVLFRKSKLSETDAPSYRNQDPGPLPSMQSTFVPDSWKKVDKVSIRLLTLDAWGLVRADLTGFILTKWDRNGKELGQITRDHGDEVRLNPDMDLYNQVGVHLRLALAVHRRGGANRIGNLGAFLQTAPALATLNAADRQTARIENVDPVKVALGRERCEELWRSIFGGTEEEDTDMEENNEGPCILVDWVPKPIGIGVNVPDGRLYQAAIAWLLEENDKGRVIARIKTTWQDSVSVGDLTVRHYVDGDQISTIFLRHGSSFEIDAVFGDWLASHLSNLDISLTQPFQGAWVRMDRLQHPMGLDPDRREHVVLVRTHSRAEQLSNPPAFALRQPSATDLLPLEGMEDALIGDALLEERGSGTPSTALSMWISMQQALNNWQNARSLNEPVGALPDTDLMLALDSPRMQAGWDWPAHITFSHLVQMVAAVARLPWVAFVEESLKTIFSHWNRARPHDVKLESLEEAASLLRMEDACMLLALADKPMSTITKIPAHHWWTCQASTGRYLMFDRQGFRTIDSASPEEWAEGRWSEQWNFEKIYCLFVLADRNGGSALSVQDYEAGSLGTVCETHEFHFPNMDVSMLLANVRRWTKRVRTSQVPIIDYHDTQAWVNRLPSGSGDTPSGSRTHASRSSAGQGLRKTMTGTQRRVAIIMANNPDVNWDIPVGNSKKKGKQRATSHDDGSVEARLSQLSMERRTSIERRMSIERADSAAPPLFELSVGKEYTPPPESSAEIVSGEIMSTPPAPPGQHHQGLRRERPSTQSSDEVSSPRREPPAKRARIEMGRPARLAAMQSSPLPVLPTPTTTTDEIEDFTMDRGSDEDEREGAD